MRRILEYMVAYFFKFILSFRYRIRVKGLDKLNPQTLKKPGGVVFLPNHPAYFIDPIVVTLAVWPKFPIRPMVVEYMYYTPIVHGIMKFLNALPIPDFVASSNSLKRKKSEQVIKTVVDDLKQGQNFLIYPAGRVKLTAYESLGGASAVHRIVQEAPEANIVLVRTKGLWGSRFSRAVSNGAPSLSKVFWDGVKMVFKNLIFFSPRREITIELEPAPADFPYHAQRLEMNKYLEKWYNRPDGLTPQKGKYPGESLVQISYSMWSNQLLPVHEKEDSHDKDISIKDIPKEVQEQIRQKLADLGQVDPASIKPDMSLASDLGLDSLDAAELVAYLQDQFEVFGVPAKELTTVAKLMAIASKKIECKEEIKEEKADLLKWKRKAPRHRAAVAEGDTIAEVFLDQCRKMGDEPACADERVGIQSYSNLKLRVILLAEYVRHLPGTYVGILLPASVAANLLILACELAGKVPLMVNWTVGKRHLESVVQLSDVKVVLSSWAFLDRLDNVELDGVEDRLVMLEDVIRELSIFDKIKALIRSKKSAKSILRTFGADKIKKESPAVLLFTSGTESLPKGVPLTHENLLANMRSALAAQELYSDDVIFAMLPPFHSFGFTVTGVLGLLAGIRIAYSPNPTDGPRLASGFANWQATILCGAPTFIKGVLKVATKEQMETMRMCVSGAEKAPPELFKLVEEFGRPNCIAEGYGITECSPILTLNPPGSTHKGVGKAVPNVELCIVHQETEKPLPIGERGLILAKGPNVFSGYINPGLSSPFLVLNGEKWYKTGDLGYLDEEGYLTISGRMKRFVKFGAEMVSLASVEDALLQIGSKMGWAESHEGPLLAVCAKELPGEKPKLYLFCIFESSVDEINAALRDAGFSNLVKISSVTRLLEIPIMGTGKVNYRALESKYLAEAT